LETTTDLPFFLIDLDTEFLCTYAFDVFGRFSIAGEVERVSWTFTLWLLLNMLLFPIPDFTRQDGTGFVIRLVELEGTTYRRTGTADRNGL
jgi:hypothetical protein